MREGVTKLEIGLTSPVAAMEVFLEPHRAWIESVVGCRRSETVTLEVDLPFSSLVAADILRGAPLDAECVRTASALRSLVSRWETSASASPRIRLATSRDGGAPINERKRAWDPQWRETPIALWLRGIDHGLVAVNIPYVSYIEKGALSWVQWAVVNRQEAAACLRLLSKVPQPKCVRVACGRDLPLPKNGYRWDSVILDPSVSQSLRSDYEAFWEREAWFADCGLPYRRGYLLYGPPGNGKTSVARIMASHPDVSAFSVDFTAYTLSGHAMTEHFQMAADRAPAVMILEDLDRIFRSGGDANNASGVTLQHLLNCIDGIGSGDGVVVIATANDPARLDPAILKRPGRFDRLVPFPCPSASQRQEYLARLTRGAIPEEGLVAAVQLSDGLSFAQIREAYIVAAQQGFNDGAEAMGHELVVGIRRRAVSHEQRPHMRGRAS